MRTKTAMAFVFALLLLLMAGCGEKTKTTDAATDISNSTTTTTPPASTPNPTTSSDAIKIGVLLPYSGTLVCTGNYREAAARLAIREINKEKIFGKELELATEDDETNPDKAVRGAERLLAKGVVGIIGSAASSSTIKAATDVAIPNDILMISPSSTSPNITTLVDKGLVWRTAPSDVHQGKVAANYVYNGVDGLGVTNASIIYVDNAYGQGLAATFKLEFETLGGSILNSVSYPELSSTDLATYDFSAKVASAFSGNPELIYLVSYAMDGAKISLTAKDYFTGSYTPKIMGVDGNYKSVFLSNADPTFTDGMVGTAPTAPSDSPNYRDFAANYKLLWGIDPPPYTANTYDAVYLLAYAMLKADSTVSKTIAAELKSVSVGGDVVKVAKFAEGKAKIINGTDIDYQGASGEVDFDDNGDVTSGSYLIWRVEGGQFKSVSTVAFTKSGLLKPSAAPTKAVPPDFYSSSGLCFPADSDYYRD